MAVQISESFQLYAHAPLDSRSQFRTVAEMRSFPTSRLYEGIIASVVENTTTYQFFSSNEDTEETGKWRIFGANTNPIQEHDRDAVHLVMNITTANIQPGDNYLYIGSEPYSAPGKELITGDIFTVNTDGSFTVLFHVGSNSSGPSEPIVPDPDNPNPDNPDPDKPGSSNPEPDKPGSGNPDPDNPETVDNPIITIANNTVTLTCNTENAVIHYTLDGTDPDVSSTVYTSPFTLSDNATIKAIAIKNDKTSAIVTKVYEVPEQTIVTEPEIIITENGEVTLVNSTDGATIYYTTDGTNPSTSSQVYSGAFVITNGTTIKAIAVKNNVQSLIVSKTYTAAASKNYVYYGIISGTLETTVHATDEGLDISEASIPALTKKEATSNAGTFAFVAAQKDYDAVGLSFKVYAYPARFGELTEYDFGFGTNSISPEFTKFDREINGEAYYVYVQETGFAPAKVGATYNYTFN